LAGWNNNADPTICAHTYTAQADPTCLDSGAFGWATDPTSNKCIKAINRNCDTANGWGYDSSVDKCVKGVVCPSSGNLINSTDVCEMTPGRDCGTNNLDNTVGVCYLAPVCTGGQYDNGLGKCTGSLTKNCGTYTISATDNQLCQKAPACPADTNFANTPGYSATLDKCSATPVHNCATDYTYSGLPVEMCEATPRCTNGTQIPGTSTCSYAVNCAGYTTDTSVTPPVCQTAVPCPNGTYDAPAIKCSANRNLSCPAGSFACTDTVGDYSWKCSANLCEDMANTTPTVNNVTSTGVQDNGARDPNTGQCQATIQIFAGKSRECRNAGLFTGYQNCCNDNLAPADTATNSSIMGVGAGVGGVTSTVAAASAVSSTIGLSGTIASTLAASGPFLAAGAVVAIGLMVASMLLKCDQDDFETVTNKVKGKCHKVGRYCRLYLPITGCIQHATSFCCFDSMLSRIIHEQGRPMISTFNPGHIEMTDPVKVGTHYRGTDENLTSQFWLISQSIEARPDNLNCRGFTVQEFSLVDMGNVDMSEWVDDMTARLRARVQSSGSEMTSTIQTRVNNAISNQH